ncbi:MAG: HlyD family secretion protein [Gemmataceae bacterium]
MTSLEPIPVVQMTDNALIDRVQELRLDSQLGQSKSTRGGGASWFPWLLCGIMAISWAGVGIRAYKNGTLFGVAATDSSSKVATGENSKDNSPTSIAARPVGSTNSTGNSGGSVANSGDTVLALKGNLIPAQQLAVSPIDVGGRVVELRIVEGMLFKKGELLARIEDVSYQAMVREAEASLTAAEKRLDASKARMAALLPGSVRKIEMTQVEEELREAEATRARWQDELSRLEKLSGAAIADREAKQARFDMQASEARVRRLTATLTILKEGPRQEQKAAADADVETARAEVEASRARLAQAQWKLKNCEIHAPIDGTILTKKAEIGNLVNPMAFSSSTSGGGAICDLANLADMEVEIDVPERDISKVRIKQAAKIRSDAYSDKQYVGYVDRIMPIADDSKSVIKVRVKVVLPAGETPGKFLKPKMSVVVTLVNEDYTS